MHIWISKHMHGPCACYLHIVVLVEIITHVELSECLKKGTNYLNFVMKYIQNASVKHNSNIELYHVQPSTNYIHATHI